MCDLLILWRGIQFSISGMCSKKWVRRNIRFRCHSEGVYWTIGGGIRLKTAPCWNWVAPSPNGLSKDLLLLKVLKGWIAVLTCSDSFGVSPIQICGIWNLAIFFNFSLVFLVLRVILDFIVFRVFLIFIVFWIICPYNVHLVKKSSNWGGWYS